MNSIVDGAALASHYRSVRSRTSALVAPLSPEDATVQSMGDTSPSKWHLAHTTWFFEQFVLGMRRDYRSVNKDWNYLFNSYYNSVGPMHARLQRGHLTRPGLAQVGAYRDEVDARMARAFERGDFDEDVLQTITLGLHHEQQHQELLLTDIKHALFCNPLRPAYREDLKQFGGGVSASSSNSLCWITGSEDVVEIGAHPWPAHRAFAFDSETPRHRVLLHPHALASRPVSNAEYRQFIDDGGYRDANLWMSEGWAKVQDDAWTHPLYWDDDCDREFTLAGMRAIDPGSPVSHLSYYEADAFARWAGARLPTEAEWEHAAEALPVRGNFADDDALHPQAGEADSGLQQMFGDVWEWTSSAYMPYPKFRTLPGALGEYNGKFMCGQWVLRGGSCASPADHLRASYRNFFHPPARWQFSGLRLAKDLP